MNHDVLPPMYFVHLHWTDGTNPVFISNTGEPLPQQAALRRMLEAIHDQSIFFLNDGTKFSITKDSPREDLVNLTTWIAQNLKVILMFEHENAGYNESAHS